ncbi:DUF6252 family protein [Nonlabens antarcticus]|uniref:DUF6252 family protein n=1 Tax=Nonlabens antarcticus TaxID=392714 RepID=UPI001891E038|nr:DUF6252 family protein [Nonlabens antarcticus]
MKKLGILFSLVLVLLTSCEENLDKLNVPALQASRNGEFFGSTVTTVTNNPDGTITIGGENPLETLQLKLTSADPGVYELGQGSLNEAIYTFNNEQLFSTSIGEGKGIVSLNPGSPEGTVTGNFSFVSYTTNATDTLVMRKGVIYQVPFGTETGSDNINTFKAVINGERFRPTAITAVEESGRILVTASIGGQVVTVSFPIPTANYSDSFNTTRVIGTYTSDGNTFRAIEGGFNIREFNDVSRQYEAYFDFKTGPPGNVILSGGEFNITL